MDADSRAAHIDLICLADARHLVRSLQQALEMRGLQVTLRDFEQRARAPIGVAVLTEDGPTPGQWRRRLEPYASSTLIALDSALAPSGTDVFVLSGWPSRRADRVLSDLADFLVRELAALEQPRSRPASGKPETGPLWALGVLVLLVAGLVTLFDGNASSDAGAENVAASLEPERIIQATRPDRIEQQTGSVPAASGGQQPGATQRGSAPDRGSAPGRGTATDLDSAMDTPPSEADRLSPSGENRGTLASVACVPFGVGKAPPTHLFAWRPLLRGPEPPRIWALVQPHYYLPDPGGCS